MQQQRRPMILLMHRLFTCCLQISVTISNRQQDDALPDDNSIGADIERVKSLWNKMCDDDLNDIDKLKVVEDRMKMRYGIIADSDKHFDEKKTKFKTFEQSPYLQIQVQPATVVQGVNDIVIVCSVTNPSSLQQVFIMQLKRNISTSSTLQDVFTVSSPGVSWQDTTLQNRPGVTATGSTSTPSTTELRFTIAKDYVACPGDTNVGYICTMSGQASDGMIVGGDTTDAVFTTVIAYPSTINLPSARVVGEPTITPLRQFPVFTALELSCTGQIGSDPNNPSPSIRWCAKTSTAKMFMGLPTLPTESHTSQSGCQYTRSSSFVYNLTSSDTHTQFLCESGYSASCESGTARQYVNISIDPQIPEVTDPQIPEVTDMVQGCTCNDANAFQTSMIVGIVVALVIVISGTIINIVIWKRNTENLKSERKTGSASSTSHSGNIVTVAGSEMYTDLGPRDIPNHYDDLHPYVESI